MVKKFGNESTTLMEAIPVTDTPPPARVEIAHGPFVRASDYEALAADAARYRWLRDDNAYAPEEALVRGGEELDELCDEGIANSGGSEHE